MGQGMDLWTGEPDTLTPVRNSGLIIINLEGLEFTVRMRRWTHEL